VRLSSRNANPPRVQTRGHKSPLENPRFPTGGFVKIRAYAKINLFLDVLAKRSDGYHDIFSVMQSVSLHDELVISKTARGVHLKCSDLTLPTDGRNLVVKAADALVRECDIREGIDIVLTKRIPAGAGLAGGSSNCAAALAGINELFNLQIPHERLLKIAKTLGADVPFCLVGGTATVEGIGEKITPTEPHPPCYIVIAIPEIHVSTPETFARLNAKNFNNAQAREKFLDACDKKIVSQIAKSLYNVFTPITATHFPEISDLILRFQSLGAEGAEMSGTGSAVFAYFADETSAKAAVRSINCRAFLCSPIQRKDSP